MKHARLAVLALFTVAGTASAQLCKELKHHPLDIDNGQVIHVCTSTTTFIIKLSESTGWCRDRVVVTPAYDSCDGAPSNEARCTFVGFVDQSIITSECEFKNTNGHSLKVGGVRIAIGAGQIGCKSTTQTVRGPRDYQLVADTTCRGTVTQSDQTSTTSSGTATSTDASSSQP